MIFCCLFSILLLLFAASQSVYCCPLKGFSTFVSLPPLPEGKGTSAVPDLRVDPDEQDISVSSAVSPDDAEGGDNDDIPLEARQKRLRRGCSKVPMKVQQSTVAEDSGSSSPPSRAFVKAALEQDPAAPPAKRVRATSDFLDPDVLLTELSS